MLIATSRVLTSHGGRYLQQLCKHWSHRFEVEHGVDTGRIAFSAQSSLELSSDDEALTLVLSCADAAGLEAMKGVVEEHLRRFAFREALVFDWADAASG
uniref:DUF2218 domain-containing protein n=2 Tax=Aureimonas frigidaquae TaxID=424757 RepID=A0A0P0Z1X4_9HYPH|nr:hypothetical protein [Aureimonas frigidaquae]